MFPPYLLTVVVPLLAAFVAVPWFRALETRHRSAWPPTGAPPITLRAGTFRDATIRPLAAGRAPVIVQVAAWLCLAKVLRASLGVPVLLGLWFRYYRAPPPPMMLLFGVIAPIVTAAALQPAAAAMLRRDRAAWEHARRAGRFLLWIEVASLALGVLLYGLYYGLTLVMNPLHLAGSALVFGEAAVMFTASSSLRQLPPGA